MGEDTWKPDINHIRNLIKNFNKNSSRVCFKSFPRTVQEFKSSRRDGMLD